MVKNLRAFYQRYNNRILLSARAIQKPSTDITIGARVISAQVDDVVSLDYLISVDTSAGPYTSMEVVLKEDGAIIATQIISPPIAPGANDTVTFAGLDSINGNTPREYQACVNVPGESFVGNTQKVFRKLLDFDSTKTGALAAVITTSPASTPLFTIDAGITFDISTLPGSLVTVECFCDSALPALTLQLTDPDLIFSSLPYSKIRDARFQFYILTGDDQSYLDLAGFLDDFAADPYALFFIFPSHANREALVSSQPNYISNLAKIREAGGNIFFNRLGFRPVSETGTEKWLYSPVEYKNRLHHCVSDAVNVLAYDYLTDTETLVPHGLGAGSFRWNGPAVVYNDKLYYPPGATPEILEYDDATDTARRIPVATTTFYQFEGLIFNNKIYWMPISNSFGNLEILEYDPITDTPRLIPTPIGPGSQVYGAAFTKAGNSFYAPPFTGTDILKYTPPTVSQPEAVSLIPIPSPLAANYFGTFTPVGDKLYVCGFQQPNILEFNVATQTSRQIPTGIVAPNGQAVDIAAHVDGKLFWVPFSDDFIIEYTIATDTVRLIPVGASGSSKWLGHFIGGDDGVLYSTPFVNYNILSYDTATDVVTLIPTGFAGPGPLSSGSPAVVNGCLFFSPRTIDDIMVYAWKA